jgi:hypothetical protein
MAIKSFLDQSQIVRVMRSGSPTVASEPPATGIADPTGPLRNKTPAPVANFERNENSDYGNNQYPGPASLDPAQKHVNDYLAPSDDTRDAVIASGLARDDLPPDWQLRAIGEKNVGDAHGAESARSRQASSNSADATKVPMKTGAPPDDYPVRYGEGVKRI